MIITVSQKKSINGLFSVPGDKSVSHRALMLSALAKGTTQIDGILMGDDCISTLNCLRELGVKIEVDEAAGQVIVHGEGLYGLKKAGKPLGAGNSGTTMRLLSGILAAQPFESIITGDESLCQRPMKRIIEPLSQMGAEIVSENGHAPLLIKGNSSLNPISYASEVASAQVKSCVLLAGLYSNGETSVTEPFKSRDHTEIMLKYLGAGIKINRSTTTITGGKELHARPMRMCGDISSAAFLITAAILLENSDITITHVGVNLTRTGIISALREMGADIEILHKRVLCGENVADIRARSSKLTGTEISGALIPRIIDEIPVLAVAALAANGNTVIKDAGELKVKESNRIDALAQELAKMGARITPTNDGMVIEGGKTLNGARVNSCGDHRLAMSLAIAALTAKGETEIEGGECISISFPGFYDALSRAEK